MSAIEVRGLRKSYDTVEAVRGIDFDVEAGSIFGFLGPNGAGKTTTIEILEGYRERSAGEVSVLGVDPQRADRAWRDRIGLVLQESQVNPMLTVEETVRLYATLFTRPRDPSEVIALVGLGDHAGQRVGRLSGGQQRRLDVALGLIGDPDLVFLDEPTTGFDPSARRDAWQMIRGLRDLGKTIFLTTHYMDEAQALADQVAIIRAGQIVAEGPPAELGARFGGATRITFERPASLTVDELRAAAGSPLEVADGLVVLTSTDPQRDLLALLRLAEDRGVALTSLEVRRPSLEDVFLEVTAAAEPMPEVAR
jgi:ABC-2 type transport system ATP-binding protein